MSRSTNDLLKRVGAFVLAHLLGSAVGNIIVLIVDVRLTPNEQFWGWVTVVPMSLMSFPLQIVFLLNSAVMVVRGRSLLEIESIVTVAIPVAEMCLLIVTIFQRIWPFYVATFIFAAIYMYYMLMYKPEMITV